MHISKFFKGKNFITPNIIKYGATKKYYYELSKGNFLSTTIYGITVVNKKTKEPMSNLSTPKESLSEAEKYIFNLDNL